MTSQQDAVRKELRIAFLRTYREILDGSLADDPDHFPALIDWLMKLFELDVLCDLFSSSRATLVRWAAGATAPGPLARESVLGRIRKLVNTELES